MLHQRRGPAAIVAEGRATACAKGRRSQAPEARRSRRRRPVSRAAVTCERTSRRRGDKPPKAVRAAAMAARGSSWLGRRLPRGGRRDYRVEDRRGEQPPHLRRRLRVESALGEPAAPRVRSVRRTACLAAAIRTALIESSRTPRPSSSGDGVRVSCDLAAHGHGAAGCERGGGGTLDQPQHRGVQRVAERRHAALPRSAARAYWVRSLVPTEKKSGERRELLRQERRRRHLEHHAESRGARVRARLARRARRAPRPEARVPAALHPSRRPSGT